MASSYDPAQLDKPIMQVRHLIGDVYDFEFLNEHEIQFALDNNGDNVYKAAADCCRAIVARLSRNTDYRFSTLWQTSSQAVQHFKSLAEDLEQLSVKKDSISPEFYTTEDDEDPIFDIGQFDNQSVESSDLRGSFFRE